jgi:hypothetical protein
MKEIPLFCVEMFTKKYGVHPSFVEVMLPYSESAIKTVIKKSYLLWYRDFVNEKGEVLSKDTLYEYDSTGVLLYFKNGTHIFILTKPDKKSIVEFFIHNLKKIK